ncbi:MAG: hypothetical protein WCP20_12925 [Desulfuromonadales bacterium]
MAFDMKAKKKELLTVKHPLCNAAERLKVAYATGVALLMARADDHESMMDGEREALETLVYALDLPAEMTVEIIANVRHIDTDIVDVIVNVLETEEQKLLFLLDLYRAANSDKDFSAPEKVMINDFVEVLKMEKWRDFIASFWSALESKDCAKANTLVQAVIEGGMEPNIGHLQYFMPEFKYEEIIEGFGFGAW